MFAAARNVFGSGGYEEIESLNGDSSSINSMDLNRDGIVTEEEAREYVKAKLSDRMKNVVNQTPNSVTGHITNIVLGGASLITGTYAEGYIDSDTASKMRIAGYAMLGTGTSGLIGSGFKFTFGKPLPEPKLKEIKIDPSKKM